MKALDSPPRRVEQVRDAILAEIASGALAPGLRVIQEDIARALGVSRQPVQQALLLLRDQGLLQDAPGRGLIVAPLELEPSRHMYEVRAVMEGLAARRAAELDPARAATEGPALIENGRKAVRSRSVAAMIAADLQFHGFIYRLSANPLIAAVLAPQWNWTQRVMGEALTHDEQPRDIWDQHEGILGAIAAGDAGLAERRARAHVEQAAAFMLARLAQVRAGTPGTAARASPRPRTTRRRA